MLGSAAAIFAAVARYGENLSAPPPPPPSIEIAHPALFTANPLLHLLLAIAAVVAVGQLLRPLLLRLRQPPVIGEVIAGIALGPSLLGRIAPDAAAFLLPPSVVPSLNLVAQTGVVLYMFLVGLDLDLDRVRSRAHATVAISHASIVVPFVLGSIVAVYLYPRFSTNDVAFTSFALFTGVAMSITAFPVLARILSDRGLTRSELGVMALTCAAVDDVTAWCLMAGVVGVSQARPGRTWLVILLSIGFIVAMLFVIKPVLQRRASGAAATWNAAALTIAGLAASAFTTEWIGIHAVFGAFLFGSVLPRGAAFTRKWTAAVQGPVAVLLLPAFFALAGMRTRIGLVSGTDAWLACALVVLVATAGKVGGAFAAARATGLQTRQAAGLGILMNTRGLMQLIVLNIGLELGVLSPMLFTMMVLMALVTTMATSPLLDVVGVEQEVA